VKILRTFIVAIATVAVLSIVMFGCKGAQQTGTEGMETTKPMTQEPETTQPSTEAETTKELPPADESSKVEPVEPAREVLELSDIHFDFDSSAINPSEVTILENNAKWMKENPNAIVTIEGHCDERGTVEYNLSLGERRAKAAKDYLVSLGIDASRINAISLGKSKPVDEGHNEAAWAKNRRDHFVVR